MELKIEDVKVGDELECIDIDLYLDLDDEWRKSRLKIIESSLIVDHIYDGGGLSIKDCELCVPVSDFKYFKKKEQSQYTFDDLIDVAAQANNDRVINAFTVVGEIISCQTLDGKEHVIGVGCEIEQGIKFIQSLYKETFVIESIEDIRRIKNSANITLSNGNRIDRAVHENKGDYVVFNDSNDDFYTFDFVVLKGATVEQSK